MSLWLTPSKEAVSIANDPLLTMPALHNGTSKYSDDVLLRHIVKRYPPRLACVSYGTISSGFSETRSESSEATTILRPGYLLKLSYSQHDAGYNICPPTFMCKPILDFSSATRSVVPSPSRWAFPIMVTIAISGAIIRESISISPIILIPTSTTA